MSMKHYPTPRTPDSIFRCMWVCFFVRFSKWRLAIAASKLTAYYWMRADYRTWEVMENIQNKLWAEVYEEWNK